MTRLPTPRRFEGSDVAAINNLGQVVGTTNDDNCYNGCPQAVLWTFKP